MRASARHRVLIVAATLTLYACDSEGPTSEGPSSADDSADVQHVPELRTAADTAAFLTRRGKRPRLQEASSVSAYYGVDGYCYSGANSSPTGVINGGIRMCAGDTLVVTVISAECSGVGDTMRVDGPVSFVLSTDACNEVGATHTGIAAVAGDLSFTMIDVRFGSGSWKTSGTYPDLVVGMEEGFGDLDYDDNVLSVHLGRRPCPPTGHPVLDDPVNREKFDSSFQASNPTHPWPERKEHLRGGYQYPDGHIESIDLNPTQATNCDIHGYSPPLINGEGRLVWLWHSHPGTPGELVTACSGVDAGFLKPYPAAPSPPDWDLLAKTNLALSYEGQPPIDMFIYDNIQAFWMKHQPLDRTPIGKFEQFDRSACQH